MSATRYSGVSRALHWISAALIIALVAVGFWMTGLADEDPARRTVYSLHKAVGVLTLFLLVARLAWLRMSPAPALPDAFAAGEKRVVKGLQTLLYGLMLLVPFSGYLMSTAKGYPVSFFGLFNLPAIIGKSEAVAGLAEQMHMITGYLILAIVAVHVAGALKHRMADRNGPTDVLARML